MRDMTDKEIRDFLKFGSRTGKLATVRKDGRPHVVPIWFELDGDDLVFTTWHTSVKAKNMVLEPRVSLCVDEESPPYAFVMVEGTVSMSEEPGELAYWARRIAARYMGEEQAEAYGKRNSVDGELLVRLHPTKIIAKDDVSGW
jgi:PPOX class probable F420-dependent enzyme